MGVAKGITLEVDLMREGAKALIDRLGYANAARFIAILGGEGDSVTEIREKRMKSDIDAIVERIKGRSVEIGEREG